MIRSCVRQAVRVFAGAALVGFAWQAFATTFTMNCDSLTLTGTAPNQVLTCNIGSVPPSGCSIQGPSSGVIGTPVNLTAVCTAGTAPLTYAWSGGSAANCTNQQQCSVSDGAGTSTYTVAISNAQGAASPSPTTQVVWSNNPIGPAGCSLNPSTSSLPVGGGSVSLSMDCSTGSGLSYSWTGGFAAGANTQQVSGSIAATTTFQATASNSQGTVTKSATVTVATGGGGGPISCSGFLSTNVLTLTWPQAISKSLGMGQLDAGVVVFTTGSDTGQGQITLANAGQNPNTKHDLTLSDLPCGQGNIKKQLIGSGAPRFTFSVGTGTNGIVLQTNTTYYITVTNSKDSGCAATGTTCDMSPISLQGP